MAVEFVDASTGQSFARSDIPAEQLSATFTVDTTLTLAGESWSVVRADPPTAAEFCVSGRLVLTLSSVTFVLPHDIPPQHLPIRDSLTAGIAMSSLRPGQQWLDALPQPVRHDPRRLLTSPHGRAL